MKNTKMIIEKILLFVIFTMLLAMYYYKISPYVRRFGLTIPKEKEYIETDFFQNDFEEAVQRIESSVSWGIFENNIYEAEFNQYNRDRTNIEYILDIEQTNRKSMVLSNIMDEDLIEVSKISSGNETVALEKIDFKELVLQANGEFAEKFEEKNLEVISNLPKEAVIVDLDGKKMWRVLENLYQNVYKYSLENTRVYVDLMVNDHIVFTIKNISKEKLNILPEELMERFIRGDSLIPDTFFESLEHQGIER